MPKPDAFATCDPSRELAGALYRETFWLVADRLGTPRMVADRTGGLAGVRRHDYLPFGEELSAGAGGRTTAQGYGAADNVRQKFTGYEHDEERVLVAERRYRDADRTLAGALKTLEQGDASALLAEALSVQGVIWARLLAFDASLKVLRWASEVAEGIGAKTSAAQAVLTLIEEHGSSKRLTPAEAYDVYQKAERLLKKSQDAEDRERLLTCAHVVMRRLSHLIFVQDFIRGYFCAKPGAT
jgi:hypothetical protein